MAIKSFEDKKLIKLLQTAYSGKLLVRFALIKTEGIWSHSNYKPTISEKFRKYFEEKESECVPSPLHVYPQDDGFIMSDDYCAYSLYKEKGYRKIMCIVLGESNSKYVVWRSELFKLPIPEVKFI